MIKEILAALFALCLVSGAGTASAQSCNTYPNTLTNGTSADANQVMANFNYVLNCVNSQASGAVLRGRLGGLTLSNNATNPNTVINTAAGVANSDDATYNMSLAAFTKNANAAWALGNGNGCLDSGSALAASTWYHLFVIARTDTGVVDELCSTSASAPTMPASYTKKRRIGSFRTNSSSQILGFSQNGDEFLLKTPITDLNSVTIGTSARSLVTLTVPTGIQVNAWINVLAISSTGAFGTLLTSPDQADGAPIPTQLDLYANGANLYVSGRFNIRTSIGAQIGVRSNPVSASYSVNTLGWIDTRGRFN